MDHLCTPWRYAYITAADKTARPGVPAKLAAWTGDLGCVFCNLLAAVDHAIEQGMSVDEAEGAGGIVCRGQHNFICMNAYPYTSGHVMVLPYAHLNRLNQMTIEASHEMMDMARKLESALQNLYRPQGFNFGLNLGEAAGAGVANHLHLHAMPRWVGDTNFMTTIAETRVLPEALDATWAKIRAEIKKLAI